MELLANFDPSLIKREEVDEAARELSIINALTSKPSQIALKT